jgi:uncharacterized protein (DUF305 family)
MQLRRLVPLVAAVTLSALALAACGGGDESEQSSGSGQQAPESASGSAGAEVDRAFIAEMIPHHESAIEMAVIAQEQAQGRFVRDLAEEIVDAQQGEIETLRRIDSELETAGVEPGDLGTPAHMQGMDDDPDDLRGAEPFDRAFVEMMIPHHQGAVAMAEVEVGRGDNDELKSLARRIIDAQQREIDEMRTFLEREYGGSAPEDHGSGGHGG